MDKEMDKEELRHIIHLFDKKMREVVEHLTRTVNCFKEAFKNPLIINSLAGKVIFL